MIFVPPKISVRARDALSTSVALAIRVEPVSACRQPATSRPSYVPGNRISDGVCCPISQWSVCAAVRPGWSAKTWPSLAYTMEAPWAPSSGAALVAPGPSATAATSPPSARAFVSSSSALGCAPSGVTSA